MRKCFFSVLALFVILSEVCCATTLQVANAPENNQALTVQAIQSAKKSILLNIYELSSSTIADALVERIQAGVQVDILEEGQPVGGLSAASKGIQATLLQAMGAMNNGDHLYEMTSKAGAKRRFHYDHAKYAVIDGTSLLIGSENYSPTGNPDPGSLGNRGWEVLVQDSSLAAEYTATFQNDTDLSYKDVLDLPQNSAQQKIVLQTKPKTAVSVTTLTASNIEKVTSPDTSTTGLLAMINGATSTLDIEQMTFDSAWGKAGTNSPLFEAVLAAARRGVHVRVLLNDETVFLHGASNTKSKNLPTIAAFNQAAQSEGLSLSAKTADLKAMGVDYIHNKGMLADDKTLVSSINWDENSVEKNREAAVVVTSPSVYQYYEGLFEQDWNAGGSNQQQLH